MTKLSKQQQVLISQITKEFMKINALSETKSSFNLIDINPLLEKSNEIHKNKNIVLEDVLLWGRLAIVEAQRIVELLKPDLPTLWVDRYGIQNGHHELPSICIQRKEGISGHHENFISIEVVVIKETIPTILSHGIEYKKGVSLGYKHSYSDDSTIYNSIEDLFEKSKIKECIRNKFLGKKHS